MKRVVLWQHYWYWGYKTDEPHLAYECYTIARTEGIPSTMATVRYFDPEKKKQLHEDVPVAQLERDYRPPRRGARLWWERSGDYLLVTATGKRDGETVEVEVDGDFIADGGAVTFVHMDQLTPVVRDLRATNPEFYDSTPPASRRSAWTRTCAAPTTRSRSA